MITFKTVENECWEKLHEWSNDPRCGYMGRTEQTPISFKEFKGKYKKLDLLIAAENDFGQMVGVVMIKNIDPVNRNCEIHIMVDPEHRNGMVGFRLINKALTCCFEDLGLHKAWSVISDLFENVIKCAKKYGFEVEGCFRDHLIIDNEYHNIYIISILEDDWRGKWE